MPLFPFPPHLGRSTRLTTQVESITGTTDKIAGLAYYQSLGEDGVSLRCLSTGTDAELIQMNPLYEIAMYGLWGKFPRLPSLFVADVVALVGAVTCRLVPGHLSKCIGSRPTKV